jgi:hypothetical protein
MERTVTTRTTIRIGFCCAARVRGAVIAPPHRFEKGTGVYDALLHYASIQNRCKDLTGWYDGSFRLVYIAMARAPGEGS